MNYLRDFETVEQGEIEIKDGEALLNKMCGSVYSLAVEDDLLEMKAKLRRLKMAEALNNGQASTL